LKFIEDIIHKADIDKSGKIEYSEFLTQTITKKQLSEANVNTFFTFILPKEMRSKEEPGNSQDEPLLTMQDLQKYLLMCGKNVGVEAMFEMLGAEDPFRAMFERGLSQAEFY